MKNLSIRSINCRGLNTYEKRVKLFTWLNDINADIIFIQETHFIEKNEHIYNSRWHGKSIHSFSDSQYSRGVSILFRKQLPVEILNVHRSNDGRRLLVNLKFEENVFTFVNIYAPNQIKERNAFLKRISTWCNQYTINKENFVIGGDFNCELDNENSADKSLYTLKQFINSFELSDVWRSLYNKEGFTWCNGDNIPTSRIDYIFISSNLCFIPNNVTVRRVPGSHSNGIRMSDHMCLKLTLDISGNIRGPGYWKFNTSLLENKEFINSMNSFLENFQDSDDDSHTHWEKLKTSIKTFCINFSKRIRKSYNLKIKEAENELNEIEILHSSEIDMNRKRFLEESLSNLINEKSKGAQIRSRANWVEKGEKNTSYFLRLENQRQTCNTIKQLRNEDDTLTTDNDEILRKMSVFYENLYKSYDIEENKIEEYFSNVSVENILNENDRQILELFPTLQEFSDALSAMKNNKSPGLDGLPSEFYKMFWPKLKKHFFSTIQKSFDDNKLPLSQRLSVLSIIYKKGDKNLLENYRPISLTNTDYKIIAFTFARRLQKVINNLISNDQSAYIKGRFIGLNARIIADIFEYCENCNEDGILLFLDFQKAFDSVEWNFMFKALKSFNFGINFLKWLNILYTEPLFRMKNNGWISKTCKMSRGIRQGCPISAIIFLFVTEILAIQIRKSNSIKGINMVNNDKDNEIRIVQHADDCTLPLKDEVSMNNALDIINKFSSVSGMILNTSKSESILMGNLKHNYTDNICGININSSCVKTLGIYIGHDKTLCYKNNILNCIKDMEKLFEAWKTRNLTLFGKTCVINTLALSKILYRISVLSLPCNEEIKTMNRLIFKFLWNKTDRIKRNTLIRSINEGGIGVIDVESKLMSIKASWVEKLLNSKGKLKSYVESLCLKNNIYFKYILITNETDLKNYGLIKNFPIFYQQIFICYNKCKQRQMHLSATEFLQQPIWNNKLFTYKGKTLYFPDWIKSNLLYVKDICDSSGLKPVKWFLDNLKYKSNWICQYKILYSVFREFINKYDLSIVPFITNSSIIPRFQYGNKLLNLSKGISKFFYKILCSKKSRTPIYQSFYEREFHIQCKSSWVKIYRHKIANIFDKKVAEFNYKLLNNLLSNNLFLSKCCQDISSKCNSCPNETENCKHLIFDCSNVKDIWNLISSSLKFEISWKHIVIGFYQETNDKISVLNILISFIAYRIYKFKMLCRLKSKNETQERVKQHIKYELLTYHKVLKKCNTHNSNYIDIILGISDKL